VQLECRLSEHDEKFLLKKFWRDYCPRLGFLSDGTVHTSIPSPPSFVIPEKLRNCQELLRLVTFSPVDDGPIWLGRQRKRKTLWYRRPVPTSLDGCADFNDCVACMNLLWTVLSDEQRQSDDLLQGQPNFLGFGFLYEVATGVLFGSAEKMLEKDSLASLPDGAGSRHNYDHALQFRKPKFFMALKMFLSALSVLDPNEDQCGNFDDKLLSILIVLVDAIETKRYQFVCKFPLFPYVKHGFIGIV